MSIGFAELFLHLFLGGIIMNFIERIELLCSEQGISKRTLEKEAGLSSGSTSKWKTKLPNQASLIKLSNYFKVDVDYLIGESEFRTKDDWLKHCDDVFNTPALQSDLLKLEKGIKIPVLGEVAAGVPIFAEENYIGSEEISEELASTGEFFALRIHGDSMSPRISEGDIVIIRQQDDADSGDIVIVLIDDDSATCKRLMKYQEGISLISFNPAYKPMTFSNKDIEEKPIRIIGKVVENRQKY